MISSAAVASPLGRSTARRQLSKAMNFPLITIPDPAAVQSMLEDAFPDSYLAAASYDRRGWSMFAFLSGRKEYPTGHGATPEECLADLRAKLAADDPLAKLRKEWESMGKPDLNTQDQPI